MRHFRFAKRKAKKKQGLANLSKSQDQKNRDLEPPKRSVKLLPEYQRLEMAKRKVGLINLLLEAGLDPSRVQAMTTREMELAVERLV